MTQTSSSVEPQQSISPADGVERPLVERSDQVEHSRVESSEQLAQDDHLESSSLSSHDRLSSGLDQDPIVTETMPAQTPSGPWQWLRDRSIQTKQVGVLVISQVLSLAGVVGAVAALNITLNQQLLDQAEAELPLLGLNYQDKLDEMVLAFRNQSQNPGVTEAVIEGEDSPLVQQLLEQNLTDLDIEIADLIDTNGQIISNAQDVDLDSWSYSPAGFIREALSSGQTVTTTEQVLYAELAARDPELATQLMTTMGMDPDSQGYFLVRYSVLPVLNNVDQVVGALVGGDVVKAEITLQTNNILQGGVSAIFMGDALCTVVAGDLRCGATGYEDVVITETPVAASFQAGKDEVVNTLALSPDGLDLVQRALVAEVTLKRRTQINGESFAVATTPIRDSLGRPIAVLVRGTSQDEISSLLQLAGASIALLFLILAGVNFIVGQGLGRLVVNPIRDLEQLARQYSEGNLKVRAPVNSNDETGRLAQVFNQLAASIQQRTADLQTESQQRQQMAESQAEAKARLQTDVEIIAATVAAIGDGALTSQVEVSSLDTGNPDIQRLGQGINHMALQLRQVLQQVQLEGERQAEAKQQLQTEVDTIAQGVAAIAQGNFDVRIPPLAMDSVQNLAVGINQMAGQLKELVEAQQAEADRQAAQRLALSNEILQLFEEIKGAARGNLTVRAAVMDGELSSLADAFNFLVTTLQDVVVQIKAVVEQVDRDITESSGVTEQLSSQALDQAEQISVALNQIAQISQALGQVAASAQKTESIANQAAQAAEVGGQVMDRTVSGIDDLRTTMAETAKMIKRLGESSQEIGKIVNVISDIALQTNMLALNATIEAARAGEQGRGFAVVADEVRKLAERSAQATEEIELIVDSIQAETQQVVTAMETSTQEVVTTTQLAVDAKTSLTQIIEVSRAIDELVAEIAVAAQKQTTNTSSLQDWVQEVNQAADQTAAQAGRVSQQLEQLTTVVTTLQESVEDFRTSDDI